jgi:hypothetical protein
MFTESLPTNNGGDTQTHGWEGFVKYAIEMGSYAMTYVPGFIKKDAGIKRLIRGECTYRHTESMGIS